MNNVTLAHIGGDLVLIGGVAFYFHRKTNALQEEVSALKRENKELADAVEEMQDSIQQLGTIVMQLQHGRRPQGRPPQQPAPQPVPQPVQQPAPQPVQQPAQQPNAAQLQGMMNMMQGMMPGMQPDMAAMMAQMPAAQPIQPQQTVSPVTFPPASGTGGRKRKTKKVRRPVSDSDDSGDETLDDRELDKELAGEYQQLAQERQGDNCDGETCQLVE